MRTERTPSSTKQIKETIPVEIAHSPALSFGYTYEIFTAQKRKLPHLVPKIREKFVSLDHRTTAFTAYSEQIGISEIRTVGKLKDTINAQLDYLATASRDDTITFLAEMKEHIGTGREYTRYLNEHRSIQHTFHGETPNNPHQLNQILSTDIWPVSEEKKRAIGTIPSVEEIPALKQLLPSPQVAPFNRHTIFPPPQSSEIQLVNKELKDDTTLLSFTRKNEPENDYGEATQLIHNMQVLEVIYTNLFDRLGHKFGRDRVTGRPVDERFLTRPDMLKQLTADPPPIITKWAQKSWGRTQLTGKETLSWSTIFTPAYGSKVAEIGSIIHPDQRTIPTEVLTNPLNTNAFHQRNEQSRYDALQKQRVFYEEMLYGMQETTTRIHPKIEQNILALASRLIIASDRRPGIIPLTTNQSLAENTQSLKEGALIMGLENEHSKKELKKRIETEQLNSKELTQKLIFLLKTRNDMGFAPYDYLIKSNRRKGIELTDGEQWVIREVFYASSTVDKQGNYQQLDYTTPYERSTAVAEELIRYVDSLGEGIGELTKN